MTEPDLALFSLRTGRALAERVAGRLGISVARHEERDFEWGQHKTRPLESVRGRDVYVLESLHGEGEWSANDKLVRLLFFLATLRDAGAARLTAVVPFLAYSRKDRRTKPRDPVTTRYLAELFEAAAIDRFVTLEVHNVAAYQNAFRCPAEHLEAHRPFADLVAERLGDRELAVVSPDVGGVKRAERFREILARRLGREVPSAFVEKQRSADVVSGGTLVGDVAGRTVVLVDDMIVAGTTLGRAAASCRAAGAREVWAVAAHGAFVPAANAVLAEAPIERMAVLDHMAPAALEPGVVQEKLVAVDAAPLLGEAIRRLHEDGSLVELLEG